MIGPILTFRPRPVVLRTTRKNVARMCDTDETLHMQHIRESQITYRQVAGHIRYRSALIREDLQGLKVRCSTS